MLVMMFAKSGIRERRKGSSKREIQDVIAQNSAPRIGPRRVGSRRYCECMVLISNGRISPERAHREDEKETYRAKDWS